MKFAKGVFLIAGIYGMIDMIIRILFGIAFWKTRTAAPGTHSE